MRALIITPTPTHPTTQGNRARVFQIANTLKQEGAVVDLLYYAIDGVEAGGLEKMQDTWDTVYAVGPNGYRAQRSFPSCWGLDDWISPGLLETTRAIAGSVRYDAVIVNYVWCSLLLTVFPDSTLRVLDTHDAFGGRRELALSIGLQPHWFYTSVEEEGRGLDRADVVLAIQSEEGRYFSEITSSRVEVVEYAIPPNFLPTRPIKAGEPLTIGYLGSGNPWNVKGVAAMEVALLNAAEGEAARPAGRFLLFGGITKTMSDLKVFESCGMVDDVCDAYLRMDVAVNPMIGGTGLKIKTVEGLAFGRMVLSTKAGASGLGIAHADLLHEDIDSLVKRVVDLVGNPAEAASVAEEMKVAYAGFYAAVKAHADQTMRDIVSGNLGEITTRSNLGK